MSTQFRKAGRSKAAKGAKEVAPGLVHHGWVFFYHQATRFEPAAVGRLAVAGDATGKAKRLGVIRQSLQEKGAWDIQALDGSVAPAGDVAWASPVLWARG